MRLIVRDITCIEGKNILLLLEGWDELSEDKQLNKSFFASIIAGKVLKKGSVLITSRPSSIGSIQKKFITRNIAILGFSNDQIEQYIDQCFLDSSHGPKNTLKHKFMAQLNSNPMLKSLAYVPANLSILVYVFTQYESKLPDTLTELYLQYVLLKLSLYNQRQSDEYVRFSSLDCLPDYITESFNKLCELAYGGIKNQKLYFTQSDVEKLYQSVPLEYDGMGLLQVDNYMLRRESNKTYQFIHKTVQELLAAMHMTKAPNQKNSLLKCFENESFEMVFVFYAGLTGLEIFNAADFSPYINERYDLFLNRLLAMAFNISGSFQYHGKWSFLDRTTLKCIRITPRCNEHRMSVLITCCAEAKNSAMCKAFSKSDVFLKDFCYIKFSKSVITSQLLSSLSYCIAYSGKEWCVHLNSVLCEQDVVGLQKHLFDANDVTGKHFNNVFCKQDVVGLQKHFYMFDANDVTGTLIIFKSKINNSNVMRLFIERFLQPHSNLCSLDLSYSKFDDDCITILCEGLKLNGNLIILKLNACNISFKEMLTISEMLWYNYKLEYLGLEKNNISSEALIEILQLIKCNITLRIMEIDDSLVSNKQVEEQLVQFNKKRNIPLMLSKFSS